MGGIFFSNVQILLLLAFTELAFNNVEALTELNFVDVTNISSIKRLVFLPCASVKSNFSANVFGYLYPLPSILAP